MMVKTKPLARHQDHLVLIEEVIAAAEAAIGKGQQDIRRRLRDGADVSAEIKALRAREEALRRLRADREATLRQISRNRKA
jgi:flagellar motility protein MotE (MotC chaperone)